MSRLIHLLGFLEEKFENTKAVIRNYRKDRQYTYTRQKKQNARTNNDLQKLHRKLNIKQHESQLKPGVNSGAPKELAVPVPLVLPVVFS